MDEACIVRFVFINIENQKNSICNFFDNPPKSLPTLKELLEVHANLKQ